MKKAIDKEEAESFLRLVSALNEELRETLDLLDRQIDKRKELMVLFKMQENFLARERSGQDA